MSQINDLFQKERTIIRWKKNIVLKPLSAWWVDPRHVVQAVHATIQTLPTSINYPHIKRE